VYFWAFIYYILRFRGKYDMIVDCQNGIPFFTPLYAKEPVYCLMHHVHQDVFKICLPKTLGDAGRIYGEKAYAAFFTENVPFITVSQSSRLEMRTLVWGSGNTSH